MVVLKQQNLCPNFSTQKVSEPAVTVKSSPVFKKVHHKKLTTDKGKKVEGPTTSSDNEGSFERRTKTPRAASSASVMHVQPLFSDDDDDHNLLISTLTGGHGVIMDHRLKRSNVESIPNSSILERLGTSFLTTLRTLRCRQSISMTLS